MDIAMIFRIIAALIILGIALFLVFAALVVMTFAANLFLALFKPVTDPIRDLIEEHSENLSDLLDNIPLFSKIKGYFGSAKNILFICFVVIFLIIHYLSLGHVGNAFENVSLLFPGSVLEQFLSIAGVINGPFDFSSLWGSPDSYLQTILFSFVSGLFIHIGCTTKAPGSKIHFLVKLLYIPLITLFSSIVLGMIPPDMLKFSFPEISLDLTSVGTVPGDSAGLPFLAQLAQWGGTILQFLVKAIPAIVALYCLSLTISGFATALFGGFIGLFLVSQWLNFVPQDLFSDVNAVRTLLNIGLFPTLVIGEVTALALSEKIGEKADALVEKVELKFENLLKYYNIVTISISYFFYPVLPLSFMCMYYSHVREADITLQIIEYAVALAGLLVFSLASFAGYKIDQFLFRDRGRISGTTYVAAMLFPIPVWILYAIAALL